MKKVTIAIASKDYTISLNEEFAKYLEKDLANFLNEHNAIGTKELLTAYVQKCFDNYTQNKQILDVIKDIDKSFKI